MTPHEVTIERERLRKIKEALPEAARPLDGVIQSIIGLTVAESTFTYSPATAYSEAETSDDRSLLVVRSNTGRLFQCVPGPGSSNLDHVEPVTGPVTETNPEPGR
ncbi:hypothetical protein [Streptosporangium amethystogenes]|uniref:hypothetical protein n=1 Tax=Streptosporangium amethystogenes TaxID=2002 RepID=UPI0004C6409F|nr:hypothetical protein [Streptosporangium amethystogenes]